MKITVRALFALFVALLVLAGCAPKHADVVVLEVGTGKVTLGEYENFYVKNSGGWDAAQKSSTEERERFLDLLTNYKLKLQDAYDRNMQKDPEIVRELAEYRASLASTFLIDKEITDPGVEQLFDRRQDEIRAQHILIMAKPDASPEETLKAWNKAMDVIARAKAGESFDSLAMKFSEDPTAKSNKGDVYYFTGGQMTPAFENAAYSMKKGEMSSKPVRTPFGYHIIRILDRQTSRGSIKASHIMARFQAATPDSADTTNAFNKIKAWADSLKHGASFAALATRYSDDPGSAPQGGSLGWFERRRWVQPFDEAVFKMKADETSGIIRTPYGYHIIRCDSVKPAPKFSDLQEELKSRYKQIRYNDDYNQYITDLKRNYSFTFNDDVFDSFVALLDTMSATDDSAWADAVPNDVRKRLLFTISGGGPTVDSITVMLSTQQEFKGTLLRKKELRPVIDRISERMLLERKAEGLEQKYPEFGSLMKEYQDGIVLFKAEQTEVWNKVSVTDSSLRSYFSQHRDKFVFPARVDYDEMRIESDTLALEVYDSLMHGTDFKDLASRYNDDPELRKKQGAHGFQPADADDIAGFAAELKVGEISEPTELDNGGYVIIRLNAKDPAREKSFEEAGAEVSNAFQEYESKRLEQVWLDRVKQQHPVTPYKEKLKEAFQQPQAAR